MERYSAILSAVPEIVSTCSKGAEPAAHIDAGIECCPITLRHQTTMLASEPLEKHHMSKLIPNPEYEQAEIERGWITHPSIDMRAIEPFPLRFRLKDNAEFNRRLRNGEEIVSLSVPSHLEVP